MTVKSKIRKALSVAVAVVMLISCVPIPGFAEDFSATDGDFSYIVNIDLNEGTGSAVVSGYTGNESYVRIPDVCSVEYGDGTYILSVVGIGENAFANNNVIETVRGCENIVSIGKSAFSGCSKLKTCIFTGDVMLDSAAFAQCPALEIVAFNSVVHAPITLERGEEESEEDFLERLTKATDELINSIFEGSAKPRYSFSNDLKLYNYSGSLINGTLTKTAPYVYGKALGGNTVLLGLIEPDKLADENKYLKFDSSVTEIASGAFYGHTEIITAELPSSVKKIDSMVFQGCVGLTEINFPSNINSVEHHAFAGCIGLTNVTIPDTVEALGISAFENCTGIKTLSVGSGLETVSYRAFAGCSGITNVKFKDGVKVIELSAFENCKAIKNLTLPTTIEQIGSSAFCNCTGIDTLVIPAKNEYSVMASAFTNCTGIKSVDFNSNLAVLGNGAFAGCTGLEALINLDTCSALKEIEEGAFYRCESLNQAKIPENVLEIHEEAFGYCSKLSELELNQKLSKIDASAFEGCSALSELEVFDEVTVIENAAFKGCSGLTAVTIGDSVTEISDSLFEDCTSLSEVTFGGSVTAIGTNAFKNCASLPKASIPNEVTVIKDYTFAGCETLENIEFGANVATIGVGAFEDCTALKTVEIPVKVTTIDKEAFANCTELEKITIPASVTAIGENAFAGCEKLTVYCYSNSAALKYARENDIDYIVIDCEHLSKDWITDEPATCTDPGTKHEACLDCGSTLQTAVIPATGHSESDWITDKEPTCTETGSKYTECENCGIELNREEIEALGHSYGEWDEENEKKPTCTESGSKSRKCEVCGYVETVITDPTGHKASELQRIEPTCETDGKTYYICLTCGAEFDVTVLQATGHTQSDWIIDEPATCTQNGSKHRECTVCGFKFDAVEIEAVGHSESDWILDYNATASTQGRMHKECLVCGEELAVKILPALGGEYEYKITSESDKTCVITGYNGKDTQLTLPAELNGYKVTGIAESAFADNEDITSVKIPDSIGVIGESAFLRCTSLSDINMGRGIKEIGQQAFYGCDSLDVVTLPDGIKRINNDAFRNNPNLSKINLPDTLEYIAPYAFDGCPKLIDNVECNRGSYSYQYVVDNGLVSKKSAADIVSIEITSLPSKTVYNLGDELDLSGLVVTAVYSDGSRENIADYGYTGFESNTAGVRAIIINAGSHTANITYTVIGDIGDVSCDGIISVVDAKMILQYLAGTRTLTDGQLVVADVNRDGKISTVDAKWILQAVAGARDKKTFNLV